MVEVSRTRATIPLARVTYQKRVEFTRSDPGSEPSSSSVGGNRHRSIKGRRDRAGSRRRCEPSVRFWSPREGTRPGRNARADRAGTIGGCQRIPPHQCTRTAMTWGNDQTAGTRTPAAGTSARGQREQLGDGNGKDDDSAGDRADPRQLVDAGHHRRGPAHGGSRHDDHDHRVTVGAAVIGILQRRSPVGGHRLHVGFRRTPPPGWTHQRHDRSQAHAPDRRDRICPGVSARPSWPLQCSPS
jgi:hypothetical protein